MRAYDASISLPNGKVFYGYSVGSTGHACGELCFSTAVTGYQEAITDPSFAGQILLFTAPHIGNVGINALDNEGVEVLLRGVVLREIPAEPSNYRMEQSLCDFLKAKSVVAIAGVDTRALTGYLRDNGSCNCIIQAGVDLSGITGLSKNYSMDKAETNKHIAAGPMEAESIYNDGFSRAKPSDDSYAEITHRGTMNLDKQSAIREEFCRVDADLEETLGNCSRRVVVLDCGVKLNIIRILRRFGCEVKIVPHNTPYEMILSMNPDGVLISNGPGDPRDLFEQIGQNINGLIQSNIPLFGICLGHQLLALGLGCSIEKMQQGHRGINHPVRNLDNNIFITSQNHGYVVSHNVPESVEVTMVSLFDGTIAGIRARYMPIIAVQYHPEGSPGPHDSYSLFAHFIKMMGL